ITALVAIPGHDLESFQMLAKEVEAGTEKQSAIASLMRIPQKSWPKELIPTLESNLVNVLQSIPSSERTGPLFANALQLATEVATLLPESEAHILTKTLRGLGPAVF